MEKILQKVLSAFTCIVISLNFGAFFIRASASSSDLATDIILDAATSEDADSFAENAAVTIASYVNPAYGTVVAQVDDYLELKAMSSYMCYDPSTDEGAYTLYDKAIDTAYALALGGTVLVKIVNASTDLAERYVVNSADDIEISAEVFSKICTQLEEQYGPKNTANYISWRTDKRYSEQTQSLVSPHMTFFTEGYFCGQSNWQEVYLVPFYTDGTNDYYGQYQFHFYQELTTDENGNNVITLYVDYWNMVEDTESTTVTVSDKLTDYRYIDFSQMTATNALYFVPHSTYTSYLNLTRSSVITKTLSITSDCYLTDYLNIDGLSFADLSSATDLGKHFRDSVTTHDESCELGDGCNIGYYCSNAPVEMDFSGVDFSQFTAEDTVTLSGDTIYDYTITNTSGDSTTINNYITNNYNYPVTEDSSTDDSDSASGNVDVDVNVNVDVNTGTDGGSMPVDVNLENYLEQTPEQAKPITEFFAIFFDFLPAELLGLICLGVVVAIILRVWGR